MKPILFFLAVPASFAVYFFLVTQGVFQKTAWPHFLVALLAIAGLIGLVYKKPGILSIACLVGAIGFTGLVAWWMFDYSEYGEAPEIAIGLELPVSQVPGLQEALDKNDETTLVFYRGYW